MMVQVMVMSSVGDGDGEVYVGDGDGEVYVKSKSKT